VREREREREREKERETLDSAHKEAQFGLYNIFIIQDLGSYPSHVKRHFIHLFKNIY
jgi:hypothetical protein